MRLDRSRHLGAGLWERAEARQGYANGYKPKQVQSRVGSKSLQVSQTRDTDVSPLGVTANLGSAAH